MEECREMEARRKGNGSRIRRRYQVLLLVCCYLVTEKEQSRQNRHTRGRYVMHEFIVTFVHSTSTL